MNENTTQLATWPGCGNIQRVNLTEELISEILSMLDVVNLINCRLVCKHFERKITSESRLVYIIELAKANCVDGPPDSKLSVNERLRTLREREDAWKYMKFKPGLAIDRSHLAHKTPHLWQFRAGVFVVASSQNPNNLEDRDIIETLDVFFIRSQNRDEYHRRYPIDGQFNDFIVDPSQDLIVLSNTHRDTQEIGDGLPFRLLSLSLGTPHPLTAHPDFNVPLLNVDSFQVAGDVMYVTDATSEKSFFFFWKEGFNDEPVHYNTYRGCLLSESCFIAPDIDVMMDGGAPSIGLYEVRRTRGSKLEPYQTVAFYLPEPNPSVHVHYMECSTFSPTSKYTPAPPTSASPALPFVTSPDPAMAVITYEVGSLPGSVAQFRERFQIFAYARPFVSAMEEWVASEDPGPMGWTEVKAVFWDVWGPYNAFWFTEQDVGRDARDRYRWSSMGYGYRLLATEFVMDFNPAHTPPHDEHTDNGTEPPEAEYLFEQCIETFAPFRRMWLDEASLSEDYSQYALDEEVLAFENDMPDDDRPDAFTRVTVLTPGV